MNITPLAAAIRPHHFHDADRQRDLEMIEPVVDAVDMARSVKIEAKQRRQASNRSRRREC